MIELEKHKEFLWKYKLSYGNLRYDKNDASLSVYPFKNILFNYEEKNFDEVATEELHDELNHCNSIDELYDFISDAWKDFYFMEISTLLDKDSFSHLLKRLFDEIGITEYVNENNYRVLASNANEEVNKYITNKLSD